MRTATDILKEMENTGIMVRPKMTAAERLNGLLDYQSLVLSEVFNDDHAENLRLRDVAAHFEDLAREKGYEENEIIRTAIDDMDTIAKEIAIAISGASGERQVAKAIRYVRRNVIALPNISLSDGEDKTELDQIVITSNGIFVLEVKNYKKDITISEAGQIYGPCNKHYCDKNLGEQMNVKRYLLRSKLEKALADMGADLKVHIESRVVFSDASISVTDLYRQERYCFKTNLPHEIENLSSDISYSYDQMRTIASLIIGFAETDDTYDVGLDFDRIRKNFAQALVILEGGSAAKVENAVRIEEENIKETLVVKVEVPATKTWPKDISWGSLAAGFAVALIPAVVTAVVRRR